MIIKKSNRTNIMVLLLSICFLPPMTAQDHYLKIWKSSYLDLMTQQEKHMLANIIYNLLATTLAEWQIRQFATPIAKLNQAIRTKIDGYQNPNEDIAMLRTLLERLSYVTSTRTIYAQTLSTCVEYHNKNASAMVESALTALQIDAQAKLRNWANEQFDATAQLLKKSSTFVTDTIQHFQGVSRLHKGMSEGQMPVEIPEEEAESNALVVLSIILKNNPELLAVTEEVTNMLNETSDHAAGIIQAGLDVYKSYYAIVYDVITSPSHDKQYATTLFSMYDILPEEYKTQLPDVDHVFEHMLQTVKLYTQTEVSSS